MSEYYVVLTKKEHLYYVCSRHDENFARVGEEKTAFLAEAYKLKHKSVAEAIATRDVVNPEDWFVAYVDEALG